MIYLYAINESKIVDGARRRSRREYGLRLREGLEKAKNGMDDSSRGPIGNTSASEATEKAEREGHEADPY